MSENPEHAGYEPPVLTEVGRFDAVTKGQYSKSNSDDTDAGGYWE
ncbi:hypothetical protein GCM10012275_60850 [Longimycelium tulufanense]|uniref:Lasso RiPP family leader peptide-containing protein n=1 Tax=Longimycelium tulufanense TaxID=907463 RepID=A0A8J3CKF6_9PSEU|nr:lasso RiPP family leader peptide-containing protein [Longimycelium tulufanense]GGM82050.1 hypothetical protein GCM10012275_60850 [Longimycelium tulufanense]